jgi:hypothetical protein
MSRRTNSIEGVTGVALCLEQDGSATDLARRCSRKGKEFNYRIQIFISVEQRPVHLAQAEHMYIGHET